MKKLHLFIVTLVLWVILTWMPDWQELLAGALVAGATAYFFADLFSLHPGYLANSRRILYFFYYVLVLTWEIIKANLDVAYRIIHPLLPINPGIVKVKTSLKSDTAQAVLANSITLTPGTMTVDITDNGELYIHWINVASEDVEEASRIIVGKFERIIKEVFD